MEETNLLELITKSRDEIDNYLGCVSPEQFINDVKSLVKKNVNNQAIEETINKLKELL